MPVFQPMRIGARCKGHQLVSQTDRKYRYVRFIQSADFPDDLHAALRISRPVGKHNAVRLCTQDFFCQSMRRINRDFTAARLQGLCDMIFCPEIQQRNFRPGSFQHFFLFACYLLHYISYCIRFYFWQKFFYMATILLITLFCKNHAVHRAFFPQQLCQGTRIDACNARNIMFFQKVLDRAFAAEIAGRPGQFPYNISIRPRPLRFHIVKTDPVIPNQRIGHYNCLPCIGRVGQHFQISGHGCVKYNLADHLPVRTDTGPFKLMSVF